MKNYKCEAQLRVNGKYKQCAERAAWINCWVVLACKHHKTLRCSKLTEERYKEFRRFQNDKNDSVHEDSGRDGNGAV